MLRYIDLKTRIKRMLDEAATSAITDNLDEIITDIVNASHRRTCLLRSWPFLRWPREESFVTIPGIRTYALSSHVAKLLHVWDVQLRSFAPLIPLRNWEMQSIDRSIQMDHSGVIYGGFWPVKQQPTAATVLTIVSTDSADDNTCQLIVTGMDQLGDVVTETLAIDVTDGTTPVVGTVQFLSILNVTKTGTWVGTGTISIGSTVILSLAPTEFARQYPTLEFVETPSSPKTFTYGFMRLPRTLVQDNDIPDIPYPFSELIVYDSLVELATYATTIDPTHVAIWTQRKDAILKQAYEAQDELIIGSQPRVVRDLDGTFGRRVGYV
jgi:hypothetical protein